MSSPLCRIRAFSVYTYDQGDLNTPRTSATGKHFYDSLNGITLYIFSQLIFEKQKSQSVADLRAFMAHNMPTTV